MAHKRFHLSDNGPERCKDSNRACHHASHYGSVEEALLAQKLLGMAEDGKKKIAELNRICLDSKSAKSLFVDMRLEDRFTPLRRAGRMLQSYNQTYGENPTVLSALIVIPIHLGDGKRMSVKIRRSNIVDESALAIVPYYEVYTEDEASYSLLKNTVPVTTPLAFDTSYNISQSFAKLERIFHDVAADSGARTGHYAELFDDPIAADIAAEKIQDFRKAFCLLESYGRGDFWLWENGLGDFAKSDYQNIVVDIEDYNKSGFSFVTLQNFMRSELYAYNTPEVNIRVTERNHRLNTLWTLSYENSEWYVYETLQDGSSYKTLCQTPEATDGVIMRASIEAVNPGDDEAANQRGAFAYNMVDTLSQEIKRNNQRVIETAEEERKVTERLENADNSGIMDTMIFAKNRKYV